MTDHPDTGAAPAVSGAGDQLLARWRAAMLPSYQAPTVALVRGQGCQVTDADGRCYLDLLAGIAVNVLGHGHPALAAAVSRQLATLGHVSNLYASEPGIALAERLLDLLGARGAGRVFFANSGAEANEAALKLIRRWGAEHGGRRRLVATHEGFHGRTLGALAITGSPAKREPFAPLPGEVTFVPYGDTAALAAALGPDVAAVVLEPVCGEAGVLTAPAGYLATAGALTRGAGALLLVDEVQGGIGRTGAWFAHQHERDPVRPDVVTLAKGLAGGLPIGACVALTADTATALQPGQHGSTFGGNPVCAAAALAVLDTIAEQDLLASVRAVGERLRAGQRAVTHPLLRTVDGVGLWQALVLGAPVAAAVETAARHAGFLVGAAGPSRVRLAPPLVLSAAEADSWVAALPGVLDHAARLAAEPGGGGHRDASPEGTPGAPGGDRTAARVAP